MKDLVTEHACVLDIKLENKSGKRDRQGLSLLLDKAATNMYITRNHNISTSNLSSRHRTFSFGFLLHAETNHNVLLPILVYQ